MTSLPAGDDAHERDTAAGDAEELAAQWALHPALRTCLQRAGVKRFFPIQADVIPAVLAGERSASRCARDVCISAPTGSGKTLAYVIPIVQVGVVYERALCAAATVAAVRVTERRVGSWCDSAVDVVAVIAGMRLLLRRGHVLRGTELQSQTPSRVC